MHQNEGSLNFRDVNTSAKLLIQLHGTTAWFVADKRALDCFECGYEKEAVLWDRVKVLINELNTKSKLAKTQIH